MTKEETIELAIKALEYQAEEMYEGEEYNTPAIQDFVNKQWEAIDTLRSL